MALSGAWRWMAGPAFAAGRFVRALPACSTSSCQASSTSSMPFRSGSISAGAPLLRGCHWLATCLASALDFSGGLLADHVDTAVTVTLLSRPTRKGGSSPSCTKCCGWCAPRPPLVHATFVRVPTAAAPLSWVIALSGPEARWLCGAHRFLSNRCRPVAVLAPRRAAGHSCCAGSRKT